MVTLGAGRAAVILYQETEGQRGKWLAQSQDGTGWLHRSYLRAGRTRASRPCIQDPGTSLLSSFVGKLQATYVAEEDVEKHRSPAPGMHLFCSLSPSSLLPSTSHPWSLTVQRDPDLW